VLRLFVFARYGESVAYAANMLNSNPSQPVVLTARGLVTRNRRLQVAAEDLVRTTSGSPSHDARESEPEIR
jgi:hypothetical protein